MSRPLVSVIVPVHDGADEIDRCMDALEALDWPPDRLELIVVDNASGDGTPERVARRPRIRLLHERAVQSSYAARNRGLSAAAGEWLAFTDVDCVPDPAWLRRLLEPPPGTEVGAVAGEVLGMEANTPVQRLMERFGFMKHAVTLPHKKLPCFSTACVAVRRDVLLELGGFRDDVRYFADMELSWRMQLAAGRSLLFRPDAVVRHRHRRTWGELWRQGVQHGRGTAFMRRTYPGHYRIEPREQLVRLAGLGRALAAAVGLARPAAPDCHNSVTSVKETGAGSPLLVKGPGPEPDADRWRVPLFLSLWYGGLLTGYLMGPARSHRRRARPDTRLDEETR